MSTLLLPGGARLFLPGGSGAIGLPSTATTTYTGVRTLHDSRGRVIREV